MIYLPILGAIALAGGTVFEREILRKKSIDIKKYQTAGFLAISLIMLPLLFFFWRVDSPALQLKNMLIFVAVIIISIIANLLTFYSVKGEKINNLEPAKMLEPLFTILLALLFSLFFRELYESNTKVIIPALIAGFALIASHIEKEHLKINKYFLAAIMGSLFFGLEIVTSRLILHFYSPVTFYFIRCAIIFLISLLIFRPKLQEINKRAKRNILMIGIIWVIYRVIAYYGYVRIGVISTTLIFMLGSVFVYMFAKIFLKEKINLRNIIASIIILACVLYANFA